MNILTTKGWPNYELLDSGNSMRLERFGKYIIAKPDPQAIWKPTLTQEIWQLADAEYKDKNWQTKPDFPKQWELKYNEIKMLARLTPFKHTGVFPEQILNWQFIEEKIKFHILKLKSHPKILNLFAYTGIASLVAANAGATVTHLDGSKPAIAWAKENQFLSGLNSKPIRWILDDALEFTEREIRRKNTYDGIIMDPPVYGHGPTGQIWDFEKSFPKLLENCSKILSDTPLFVVANAYAISASSIMLKNLFEDYFKFTDIEYGELVLEQKNNRLLSTGNFARITFS